MKPLLKKNTSEQKRNIYKLEPLPGWASESEKMRLYEAFMEGKVDCTLGYLEEAFGTSDFTSALYDAANVSMIEAYGEVAPVWKLVSKIKSRKDFKTNYAVTAGGMGLLHKRIEGEPTSLQKPTDRKESYAIFPYDAAFGLSMEAQADDVTGVLMDNFRTFGHAAVNTLNDFVWGTSGLLGGTGSYTFSDGYATFSASHTNSNYASSTALTHANLSTALAAMVKQPDEGGTQILGVRPRYLFHSAALEVTANQICKSQGLMVDIADTGDQTTTYTGTTNPLYNKVVPVMVDTLADSEWVLAGDPKMYPTIEMGFLNGQTEPQTYMLGPNSEAEFWTRTRYMKAMIVFGGCPVSWKTIYKGTNE